MYTVYGIYSNTIPVRHFVTILQSIMVLVMLVIIIFMVLIIWAMLILHIALRSDIEYSNRNNDTSMIFLSWYFCRDIFLSR